MTLDDAAGRYWHEVGQHHAGAKNTECHLARLIEYFGAARPINTITGDDVAKLVAWRRGHKVKHITALFAREALKHVLADIDHERTATFALVYRAGTP